MNHVNHTTFVHTLSDLLRNIYRPGDYAEIILPLLVLKQLNGFDFTAAAKLTSAEADAMLNNYLISRSPVDQEIINLLGFKDQIMRLSGENNVLPLLLEKFGQLDNGSVRLIFEETIRQFMSPERGEYFTPPEAIELMVELLLDGWKGEQQRVDLYDPTCGIGGMLFTAADFTPGRFELYGQELLPINGAIAKADMRFRGLDPSRIAIGDTLLCDQFAGRRFDLVIANPPFGVSWKRIKDSIKGDPRFEAGLPRCNDSTMLFLQHCLHKVSDQGRVVFISNGSPLFTGDARSSESNIRRWIIEHDWLEAIIGLPNKLFYNTSIGTYIWVLTKQKRQERKGKIQLVDAREMYESMRRNEGEKSKRLLTERVLEVYQSFGTRENSKIFDNTAFGYRSIQTTDPERGKDTEQVPLDESVDEFFAKWVYPHAPQTKIGGIDIGYEINFNRHFFTFTPPRPVDEIMADILAIEEEIQTLSREMGW